MNSQVILRRAYALVITLVLSLLIGNKVVYGQSVTFTPNGVWLPSMTSNERITMSVTMGQLVFDTNTKSIWYHTGVGGDWKELITVKPSADNLGNHTATQNINVGDYFLSPDGSDRGLKVGREQLLLQSPKPRFQLGTNLATNSQINFANYTRNWAISTSQDRFEIVDSTFQTRPFIIEKNAFHNMLYIQEDKIGIGTNAPREKLEVAGKAKMNGFQLHYGTNTAGFILQSDAGGNGTWVNPAAAGFNYWTVANGAMFPNQNVNVGIGTEAPSSKLDVNGKLKATEVEIASTLKTASIETSGTTKTTNFQLTNGATNGYILQSDANGNASWKSPSSLPISFSESDPKVGSLSRNIVPKWNGNKLIDGTIVDNGNVGIGVTSPTNKLEVAGTTKTTNFQLTNGATNGYILQSDASGNAVWKDPSSLPISFSETDPKVGTLTNNVLPKWNGTKLSDGTIVDNGNVGIGVTSPTNKLEVAGTTKTTNFQLTNGATNGYILQSDASGNAVWKDPSSLPISFSETDPKVGTLSNNVLPKWNGTKLSDGTIVDNGNVGIGVTAPTNKLEVAGTTKTTNLQLTNGATNGYILQSDASGNAVWKDPTSLGISFTETDPKVGSQSLDYVPTWNGNKLVKGSIFDNRQGRIGILNDDPKAPFSVGESYVTNLDAITYFNTSQNKPVVFASIDKATPENNKGVMIGEQGNEIQGRSGDNLTTNGDLILNAYDGNVGIGTTTPSSKLDVEGKIKSKTLQLTDGAANGYVLQSDADGNAIWRDLMSTETDPKVGSQTLNYVPTWNGSKLAKGSIFDDRQGRIGILNDDPKAPLSVGESYVTNLDAITYFNTSQNKPVVIASIDKATPANNKGIMIGERGNEIQGRSGNNLATNGDLILNSNSGNVGIGTTTPTSKLDVGGKIKSTTLQLTNGAANGYILQSDASGNAIWKDPASLPISFSETDPKVGTLTNNVLPKWNGTKLTDGTMVDNGNIGIGVTSPTNKLEVAGTTKTTNLQLTNGATNGYVLQSDASGNASWVNPSTLSSGSTSWTKNGNNQYSSVTGNVGIGVSSPTQKLQVRGNLLVEHGRLLTYDSGKNVYVGEEVGGADTTYTKGQHNTAIGANAFQNNTTGNNNVAVGRKALQSNTTGNFNTSIGTESLNSVVGGGFNVAIGPYSLVNNVSGNENVAVGNMAGFSNKGNGNVFLGNSAGSFETGSNKLYIANTNTSTPLIYGDFSKKKLVVNDSLETKFLSVKMPNASSYFPNATINNQSVVTQIHVGNNANPKTRYYDKTNSPSSFFDIGINSYNYFSVDYNEATKFAVLPNGMVELSNNLKTFGKWITADGDNEGVVIDNEGNVGVNEVSSSVAFTVKTKKSTGGLFLIEDNNGDDKFYMSIKGNAGMGTSDLSKAKLTIVGSQLSNLSYGYLNNNGSTGSASSTSYYSLYTSDRIAASEFNAYSDARIKDIKGKTNNTADLETLAKIEITDYQFKDKIGKGNGHHKKVIAQQVETVYPQAVSKTTDIIPDIYRLANIQNNFVELPHHQLTVGEKVKLIFGEKQEVFEVEAVNEKGFKVKNNGTALLAATSVFVYGREVSDFRSVDYEALSTLNISATQALLKRIEKLESENALYKNEFKSFRTELEQLKAAVTNETKGK
ncbi:MAG: tail fiber domain-containing protein [Bacteroidetes bacterium]|nr:tail fiber domain-containing protein [Bacteroidota bacterium]